MPTWCHMFNSTLTGNARFWFDKLPRESIDSYEDLRTTFRENYLQQTKHIKDSVEIHHIKQRDGESTEDFMERYKAEILDVEGAPECMKISGFMHGITHPELIKRLFEKIPRSIDEMYRVTTSFLQGEVAAFSHSRKKAPAPWKQPEGGNKPNFKNGFKNKQRSDLKPDRFSLLTKTPKEIFALEKGKFKAPPPMHGRMHASEKADRRDDQLRQIVAIHQRIKAERQAKGTKEGGNGRKRQAPSHLDDSNMGGGSQTKGHPEFLSGDNNLLDDWSMEFDAEHVHFGQDGLGDFDWSNKDDDTPVSLALMATNSEVPYCSKCSKSYKLLLENYQKERDNFQRARTEILGYQMSLESLEVILKTHEKNEYAWGDKYEQMEYDLKIRDLKLEEKQKELDQALKERDDFKVKLEKWTNASVLQNEVLNKQRYVSDKSCIGFGIESSNSMESDISSGDETLTDSAYENFKREKAYKAVPPPTGTIIPPRANVSFTGIDELAIRNKVVNQEKTKSSQSAIDRNKVIIEDWVDSDDEETDVSESQKETAFNSENSETSFENRSPNSQNSVGQESRTKGLGNKGGKLCFVCYSPNHLIKDCNLHERTFKHTQTHKPKGTQGSRETRPVWNNIQRVNHSNFSRNSRYPHQRRSFIPSAVLTRDGLISTARPTMTQTVPSKSTANVTYQGTARSRVPQAVLSRSTDGSYYPRMDNRRPRISSYSPSSRSSTTRTPHRPYRPKKIVKSIWVKKGSTVESQAVLPQTVKKSAMINPKQTWRPKGNYLDSVNRDNGSYTLKQFEYGNPEEDLSDYAGDNHDRRSTSGGCQYLGRRLVSWQCKKQTIVAISSTEAEYVAAASCCAQVWICQILQEISQKRTRERMSDQEAKEIEAKAREIMPQPSTKSTAASTVNQSQLHCFINTRTVFAIGESCLIPSWNWMAAMVSRGFRAEGQLIVFLLCASRFAIRRRRQQQTLPVEPIVEQTVVPMADNRTMAQMLQAPIEGLFEFNNDQDALDSAAGGNFLDKMPQEGLAIIESKSKVRYSRSRANDSRVSTDASSYRILRLLNNSFRYATKPLSSRG
ncbi:reverse transcriptase domain-containing protein [Tanacetum coccineum]